MGRPEERVKPPEAEVRERLLSCASELFTRKGYAATTVREIVTAAGVTKPVLYYYFKNKEGIYLELFREPYSKLRPSSKPFGIPGERPTRRLLRSQTRYSPSLWSTFRAARLMYSIYYGPPQGAPFSISDSYHLKFHAW